MDMMSRDNVLRAVRFERPACIPMVFHINAACWQHYPAGSLEELMAAHPLLFPRFDGTRRRRELTRDETGAPAGHAVDHAFVDPWGNTRDTTEAGIATLVTRHALASWDDFDGFEPPDPSVCDGVSAVDWTSVARNLSDARAAGRLAVGGLPHGHTYLTLTDLRGYENLTYDMADDEPRLGRLIEMVEGFNAEVVRRWLAAGAEWMGYPDDLGMQVGPMLSPEHFRRYIKPSYARLIAPARQAGCIVHMHSDGDIRDLADDLLDAGVEVLNLQDLVNGLDWIEDRLAGRVCIELDIDRQRVTWAGSPADIDALIRDEVRRLGSREGGLMMIYGLYPGVPLANAGALMDAMERYATFYS